MNDSPTQFALRELRLRFASPMALAALAAVIAVIAISGPFGTLALPLPGRLLYWTALTPLTYGAGLFGSALVLAATQARPWPRAARLLAQALGATLLVSAVLSAFHLALAFPLPGLADLPAALGAVLVICLAIEVIGEIADGASAAPEATGPDRPALLDRLPLDKRGELIAISAVDHYVEVMTTKGRHMLLLRLADAMAETAPAPGLQIHRSHWVALAHVRKAARIGDGGTLTLSTGAELPIARSRLAAAQAAGLFPKAS